MLVELVAFGSIVFWLITAAIFLTVVAEVTYENNSLATFTIICYIILLSFFSNLDLYTLIKDNIQFVILATLSYVAIGVVWSVPKWYFFLLKVRDKYSTLLARVKATYGDLEKAEAKKEIAEGKLYRKLGAKSFPPKAAEEKDRIIGWMTLWPFSMVSTLIGDFITKIFSAVYEALGGMFQKMSNSVFADVNPK